MFHQAYKRFPSNLSELTRFDSDAVSLAVDVWGTPVRYTPSTSSFRVQSAGADRKFDTEDDLMATPESVIRQDDVDQPNVSGTWQDEQGGRPPAAASGPSDSK
jgi:hypothetical protein